MSTAGGSDVEKKAGGLSPGVKVRLVGLTGRPELNGTRGSLVAFDDSKGRWQVRLENEKTPKLFKPDNLEPADLQEKLPSERKPLPKEQLSPDEAVDWINSAIDEFEALLLPLQLEEDTGKIRKQFKQLSLLVHPDKNKHPEADAAFKKVFGAMEKLVDPMEQRVALRRAKSKALGRDVGLNENDGQYWWQQASVDEMEKAFRDMESRLEKQGIFDQEKQGFVRATGVNEDTLWITAESAKDLYDKDLALFIDARDVSDFAKSHVDGAHSLPGHTMEQLSTLTYTSTFRLIVENPEQNVIVYSDNGSQMSRCINVARALRGNNRIQAHRVLRLKSGLNDWKRHGYPVQGDTRALFAGQVLGNSMMRLGGLS